jgi:hypothetical protein
MLTLQCLPCALAVRQSFPLFHTNRFANVKTETQSGNTFASSSQPILKSFRDETKGAGRHVRAGFRTWKPLTIQKNQKKSETLVMMLSKGKAYQKVSKKRDFASGNRLRILNLSTAQLQQTRCAEKRERREGLVTSAHDAKP